MLWHLIFVPVIAWLALAVWRNRLTAKENHANDQVTLFGDNVHTVTSRTAI